MSEEVTLQSESVQETMLIPLWGRATYSHQYPDLLTDPQAEEIVAQLDYDCDAVFRAFGEADGISYLVRARRFDESITAYIADHPQATVVNLGAGLDTTFSRVDNGQIRWYDLDLPDAIAFRKQLIPETERSTCLARSAFDQVWFDEVAFDPAKGLFVIAGGLFMYFEEDEVRKLLMALAERFPHGEIHFDTLSKLGVAVVNRRLKDSGVPSTSFGVGNPHRLFPAWSPKLDVIESYAFYHGVRRDPCWSLTTKMIAIVSRVMGKFVHLRFMPG